MTLEDRILGLIGLARRGKYVAYGDDLAFRIRKKQIKILFVATDISPRSKKELELALVNREIKVYGNFSKEQLGDALGHDPIGALGIKNSGIAKRIKEIEEEIEDGKKEEILSSEQQKTELQ